MRILHVSTYDQGGGAEAVACQLLDEHRRLGHDSFMVVGEKRRFWIPGRLAYDGQPGSPQGTLCFEIELLDIKY